MQAKVMEITSPSQFRAVEKMINGNNGGVTLVLIWSKTCPHCTTYMPVWKNLTNTKNKATNMISMESDIYQRSPLADKKEVTSVPTVLYINEAGEIQEVEDARNEALMSNIIKNAVPPNNVQYNTNEMSVSPSEAALPPPINMNAMYRTSDAIEIEPNPLPILPGETMAQQKGGNALARVAPLAILAGAYTLYKRSSGLPAPRYRKKTRKNRKARKSRRQRSD